jgi:hypothetical protein
MKASQYFAKTNNLSVDKHIFEATTKLTMVDLASVVLDDVLA